MAYLRSRAISVALCVFMMLGLLSGITAAAAPGDVTFPLEEKLTINAYIPNLFKADGSPKQWYQEVMDRLNIEFTNTAVDGDDRAAKLLAMIASGSPPDMFFSILTGNEIRKYGMEGAFKDLKPYIDDGYLPNFSIQAEKCEAEGSPVWKAITAADGGVYNLPCFDYAQQWPMAAINTRIDLLNEAGLPLDGYDNWEDFYPTLLALKEAYPDHIVWEVNNGQIFLDAWFFNTRGDGELVLFDEETGKFIFAPLYDEFKYYTDYHVRMYKDGIMASNWTARTISDMIASINDGTTIMTVNHPMVADQQQPYLNQTGIAGAQIENILPPANTNGQKTLGAIIPSITRESVCFVVGSHVEGDMLDKILAICDYFFSEEGYMLDEWGVKGKHWDYGENGDPYRFDDVFSPVNPAGTVNITDEGFFYTSFMMVRTWAATASYNAGPSFTASNPKYLGGGFYRNTMPLVVFTEDENDEIVRLRTALSTFVSEQYCLYVTGQKSMDDYQSFVDGLRALGAEDYEAIYATAYARTWAE